MKKLLSVLCICGLLLVGCGDSGEDAADKDTLTVLTNSGYPPYEMVDKDGKLEGFDIDVMNRAAEIAGYKLKWEDVAFDGIIDSLKTDKGDVSISGITPTKARAKQVDFSDVYYGGEDMENFMLVLKDGDIKKTDDIKGKKVGVQMGTAQETTAEKIADEYDLSFEKLSNYTDLVSELKTKAIDVIIVEKAIAVKLANANPELEYSKLEAGEDPEGVAIAFKKDSKLTEKFNKAIKQMKDDGEIDELIQKWFSDVER